MMASFYYEDQNAVSGFYCQANFSNNFVSLFPREETNLNKKAF